MARAFELRVKIEEIRETQEFSEKFKKRELIGILEGEYPEIYKFEFVNSKVDLLDDLIEGTYVTVKFNIRGREVEKEGEKFHFTSLNAWSVEA